MTINLTIFIRQPPLCLFVCSSHSYEIKGGGGGSNSQNGCVPVVNFVFLGLLSYFLSIVVITSSLHCILLHYWVVFFVCVCLCSVDQSYSLANPTMNMEQAHPQPTVFEGELKSYQLKVNFKCSWKEHLPNPNSQRLCTVNHVRHVTMTRHDCLFTWLMLLTHL